MALKIKSWSPLMLVWICFPVFSSGTLLILLWEKNKSKLTSVATSTLILLRLLFLTTARCGLSWSILLSIGSNPMSLSVVSILWLIWATTHMFLYKPDNICLSSSPFLAPKEPKVTEKIVMIMSLSLRFEHRVSSWKTLKIHCELRSIFLYWIPWCREFAAVSQCLC